MCREVCKLLLTVIVSVWNFTTSEDIKATPTVYMEQISQICNKIMCPGLLPQSLIQGSSEQLVHCMDDHVPGFYI